MPEVADVLRRYGREYLDRFGQALLPSHRRAMDDLMHCRTEALGGQLLQCDHCGREHYVYHSCRNRSCPTCHHQDTEAWLEERRHELLPVPYFHVVFTLPCELRDLVRRHQKDLYDILLRAAAQALLTLAADPHYVGGMIGILCVLHTWTRALVYHPHVHCLVPAGGVSADQTEWRPARQTYLVPVRALANLFRGLFQDLVRREWLDIPLPEAACVPQGFHKVRYYGLWSPVHRPLLHQLRLWRAGQASLALPKSAEQESSPHDSPALPLQVGQRYPHRGQDLLLVVRLLPRLQRSPP